MSGKLLSLSRARKQRDRMKKRAKADENAVKFGRSKARKQAEAQQAARDAAMLDGHKQE